MFCIIIYLGASWLSKLLDVFRIPLDGRFPRFSAILDYKKRLGILTKLHESFPDYFKFDAFPFWEIRSPASKGKKHATARQHAITHRKSRAFLITTSRETWNLEELGDEMRKITNQMVSPDIPDTTPDTFHCISLIFS